MPIVSSGVIPKDKCAKSHTLINKNNVTDNGEMRYSIHQLSFRNDVLVSVILFDENNSSKDVMELVELKSSLNSVMADAFFPYFVMMSVHIEQ